MKIFNDTSALMKEGKVNLYHNGFLHTIMDLFFSTIKDSNNKTYEELPPAQKYVVDINTYNSRLLIALDEIKYTRTFLRRFPLKDYYHQNEISETKYTKYHIEFYYHKLFIIRELIRQLINSVYQLNLIKINNISDLVMRLGKEDPSILLLKDFENKLNYYRIKRNENVHQGEFIPDNDFENLKMWIDLHSLSNLLKQQLPKDVLQEKVVESLARNYRKDKARMLNESLIGMEKYINSFYDIWHDVFVNNIEELGGIPSRKKSANNFSRDNHD